MRKTTSYTEASAIDQITTDDRTSLVPAVRGRTAEDGDDHVRVPEVLSPRVSDDLERSARSPSQQSLSWRDVRQVGMYNKAMAQYSEAMSYAANASKHAVTIATNTATIRELGLRLWEKGEGILTEVEAHRLRRDEIRQDRAVLKQTEGMRIAIAHETLEQQYRRVQYAKTEDHADHANRMNEKREVRADHEARMKAHDIDVARDLKVRRARMEDAGKEGVVDDAAKRKTIATRTVLDVAEEHVMCDPSHLYHPAAAIWYWGARRRGMAHDAAAAMTVERLIDRMANDPVTLPEAAKDFKKWTQMEEELRNAAANARVENEIASERSERERHRAAVNERERLLTEAERERRKTAEVNFDTFAGGDVGDDEN